MKFSYDLMHYALIVKIEKIFVLGEEKKAIENLHQSNIEAAARALRYVQW